MITSFFISSSLASFQAISLCSFCSIFTWHVNDYHSLYEKYRVSHKRRQISKIFLFYNLNYLTFSIITSRLGIFQFCETCVFFGNPVDLLYVYIGICGKRSPYEMIYSESVILTILSRNV